MHQGWALATRDAGVRKGGVSGRVVANLRTRIYLFGSFCNPLKVGTALRLNFLYALIRYITSYLSRANLALCVSIYKRYLLCVSSRIL